MRHLFRSISTLVTVLALASMAACTGDNGGGDGGNGGSGAGNNGGNGAGNNGGNGGKGGGSSTFECCINEYHFSCPSKAAADMCFEEGDPTSCKELSTPCGGGGNGGSGGSPSKGNVGDECEYDEDCKSDICIFEGSAQFGFCSKTCMSFADCPAFWDCAEVDNASIDYCIPDE